ncbi:hypothetical protein [Lonepinella sp. BR2474]|uniref:hypothetical protein n=1 Tax=Lonepinella sp. BR2474 TaxID=3434548 RepID=UPI003F6DE8C2
MNLLSFVSIAISAAIAAQPVYVQSNIEVEQHLVSHDEIQSDSHEKAIKKVLTELANRIFMAEHALSAFYQLAYEQPSLFEEFNKQEMMSMLREAAGLLFTTRQYADKHHILLERLASFEKVLNAFTQLFEYAKYKQDMDKVVLSRVGKENIGLTFEHGTSKEEIRQKLFGLRRTV